MNLFCPNLSNKQVKREFNHLIEAVGENRAYYLWNKNNGYSLDRTSDGSPSELYQSCLKYCNGDENAAIEMKSVIYSNGLLDNDTSLSTVKEDYAQYIAKNPSNKPIRLFTVFDGISGKLGLEENATASAIDEQTIPSIKDLASTVIAQESVLQQTKDLLSSLSGYDCAVVVEPSLKDDTLAWFDGKTLHITDKLLQSTNIADTAKVLAHEYVHVALSHVIDNPTTPEERLLVGHIASIYTEAKKIRGISTAYGMKNMQEFVAEFMSNPSFRESLRSNNLYTRIINAIKQFFTGNKYQLNSAEYNDLSDYLQSTIEIGCKNINYLNGTALGYNLYAPSKPETTSTSYDKYVSALRNKITDGLEKRMRSLKFRGSLSNTNLNELRNEIEHLQSIDATQAVREFVINNMSRVSIDTDEYAKKIQDELSKDNISDENIIKYSKSLYDLNADFIGFYNSMYDDIMSMMDSKYSQEFYAKLGPDMTAQDMTMIMNAVYEHVNRVRNLFKNMSSVLAKKIIQRAYSGLTTVDDNGQERLIDDVLAAINWVDSDVNRDPDQVHANDQSDVWAINSFAGQYSSSNNPLVRIVADQLSKGRNKVERHTYSAGTKLKRLAIAVIKHDGRAAIKLLQEKDADGNTTGYFSRDLKYGLMYQDITDMYNKLGAKYKLETDKDGRYIQPQLGEKNFEKYWDDVDDWMDKHVQRKYNKKYYKLQRQLGEDAKFAIKEINEQITKILNKTRTNISDKPDLMKLNNQQYMQLHKLLIEKKQLASLYDSEGKKKEGKALEIAQQISK